MSSGSEIRFREANFRLNLDIDCFRRSEFRLNVDIDVVREAKFA
jgi:hypothetical protein